LTIYELFSSLLKQRDPLAAGNLKRDGKNTTKDNKTQQYAQQYAAIHSFLKIFSPAEKLQFDARADEIRKVTPDPPNRIAVRRTTK